MKIYGHLIEFGWISVVTDTKKLKANWANKGHKIIMTGYALNKSCDTYQVYNPSTCTVTERWDEKWLDWSQKASSEGMNIFSDNKGIHDIETSDLGWALDNDDDVDNISKPKGGRMIAVSSVQHLHQLFLLPCHLHQILLMA